MTPSWSVEEGRHRGGGGVPDAAVGMGGWGLCEQLASVGLQIGGVVSRPSFGDRGFECVCVLIQAVDCDTCGGIDDEFRQGGRNRGSSEDEASRSVVKRQFRGENAVHGRHIAFGCHVFVVARNVYDYEALAVQPLGDTCGLAGTGREFGIEIVGREVPAV